MDWNARISIQCSLKNISTGCKNCMEQIFQIICLKLCEILKDSLSKPRAILASTIKQKDEWNEKVQSLRNAPTV
eukprot:1190998-Rhodomonas_salina.1